LIRAASTLIAAVAASLAAGVAQVALAVAGGHDHTLTVRAGFVRSAFAAHPAASVPAATLALARDTAFARAPELAGARPDAAAIARLGRGFEAGLVASCDELKRTTGQGVTAVGSALVGVVTHRGLADAGSLGALIADGAQVTIGAGADGECLGALAGLGYALNSHTGDTGQRAGWDGGWVHEAMSPHAADLAVAQIRIVVESAVGILDAGAGLNRCASACALGADIVVGALVAVLAGLAVQGGVHTGRLGGAVGHNAALA